MSVIVCPWCQSEVTQEEGQEPDKFCPICDNELSGYRTLRIGIDPNEDGDEDTADFDEEDGDDRESDDEDSMNWRDGEDLSEHSETLLAYEETVERLLDDQETVPECPQCREYMLAAGEKIVEAESFRPRVPKELGIPVLEAPFTMTVYVCPSCFAMQHSLSEADREKMTKKLSGSESESVN